jgi:hypothetical protein
MSRELDVKRCRARSKETYKSQIRSVIGKMATVGMMQVAR